MKYILLEVAVLMFDITDSFSAAGVTEGVSKPTALKSCSSSAGTNSDSMKAVACGGGEGVEQSSSTRSWERGVQLMEPKRKNPQKRQTRVSKIQIQ